mgnify:CR=1 FL=1|jgi:hypothetical protein
MILKKLITGLSFLCILNGCAQNAALLGPAITGVSTGSVYQASLSYTAGKALKKITGKTTAENFKSLIDDNKKTEEAENNDKFFLLIKNRIEKNSKITDLANQ